MTELVLNVVTFVGDKIINIGIEKLRKMYMNDASPHSKIYQLILTDLDKISKKLDTIVNEPYKTAINYLNLGLNTDNITDYFECEKNALHAFNLAIDVKMKISCICLIIMVLNKCYDNVTYTKRLFTYMNIFLNDKHIKEFFMYIENNRFGIHTAVGSLFLDLASVGSCLLIVGIPIILAVKTITAPIHAFKLINFHVNWDQLSNFNTNIIMPVWQGVSKYSCHADGNLCLVGMDHVVDDLEKINMLLMFFSTQLHINSKISLTKEIHWTFETDEPISSTKLRLHQHP